jgi:hypothetical protein
MRTKRTKGILIASTVLLVVLASASQALAQEEARTYQVTVTNLTYDQIFSPPYAVAHSPEISVFTPGEPALDELAVLAEDGDSAPLDAFLMTLGDVVYGSASASGPVPPGASVTFEIETTGPRGVISVLGMLVQTNDSFFFGELPEIPVLRIRGFSGLAGAGSQTVPAWDAGSEANTESCEHIPGPPCGSAGVRVTNGAEGFVHISRGLHGVGDLAAAEYDWRNPVAVVAIERVR